MFGFGKGKDKKSAKGQEPPTESASTGDAILDAVVTRLLLWRYPDRQPVPGAWKVEAVRSVSVTLRPHKSAPGVIPFRVQRSDPQAISMFDSITVTEWEALERG